ncbi:MAG: helix-turn-helix transcriptional regulator [Rectinemataceae bacterium]|nr:helix-turn-helix transcriptional regulator [Rectinemataceae bacterium]
MGKKSVTLLPSARKVLVELGENLRLARLRRNLSTQMLAERAGISRSTLNAIESGSSSVSMGAWVQTLFVVGLEKDLLAVARDDELGRTLQDARLPIRMRARKAKHEETP